VKVHLFRIDKDEPLPDAALPEAHLDPRRNVHKGHPGRDIEPQFLPVGFHGTTPPHVIEAPARRAGFPSMKEPDMIAHPGPAWKEGIAGTLPRSNGVFLLPTAGNEKVFFE
jgi:hypothetical protein